MKYGLKKVYTDEGWDKMMGCMLVASVCVAAGTLMMACWAVVVGWSAVIERLAK